MSAEDYHDIFQAVDFDYWNQNDDRSEQMSKPENVKCPDCDGPMTPRTSQYGKFWGCNAFPKCKGTRDSDGRSKAEREAWKREQNEDHEPIDVPVESGELYSFKKKG